MDLFLILTLEEEVCVLRQTSRSMIICGMDMLVFVREMHPVVIFV